MTSLETIRKNFYDLPSDFKILESRPWAAGYSGGKDSSSLVMLIEYARRAKLIRVDKPFLVSSDTEVEWPFLAACSARMIDTLAKSGWDCTIVKPRLKDKLYNQIFGRGLPPVHPALKKMRWCTRATKADPIRRAFPAGFLKVTGVRFGESQTRDDKLKKKMAGCSAGGECGVAELSTGEDVYSPIIHWTTCNVFDWLAGGVSKEIRQTIPDLFDIAKELLSVYQPADYEGESLRFGCICCPALSTDKVLNHASSVDAKLSPLKEMYRIWKEIRLFKNRVWREIGVAENGTFYPRIQIGPIRMEARKKYFAQAMAIQNASGVILMTPEDVKFIKKCWRDQVYPQGKYKWTVADEFNRL